MMNRIFKSVLLLAMPLMAVAAPVTSAAGEPAENVRESWTDPLSGIAWTYSVDASGDATLLGVSQSGRTLIVPEEVNGRTAIAIGDESFAGLNAVAVIMPGNIESIGANAFSSCMSLAQVDFEGEPPTGLDVAGFPAATLVRYNDAYETSWQTALADAGLTNASGYHPLMDLDWEYEYCDGGVRITGVRSFYGWEEHEHGEVRLPSSLWGNPVREIGGEIWMSFGMFGEYEYAFATAVTIPDGVRAIGEGVFDSCESLRTVRIPESVTRIGRQAFCRCANLTNVTLPQRLQSIDVHAFSYCHGLSNVTIPAAVTNLGLAVFASCRNLQSIEVDAANRFYASVDGVLYDKAIRTLLQCPAGISSVEIPETVKRFAELSFMFCERLETLHIPAAVTEIEPGAFLLCMSLTNLTVDSKNKSFSVQKGILYDYKKEELVVCLPTRKAADILSSVKRIREEAFGGCTNLAEIVLPDGLIEIGGYAFDECFSLESITIPSGVNIIPDGAFYMCRNLKEVLLLGAVTNIGRAVFHSCRSLEAVTLPASLEHIGERAFERCESLALTFEGAPPQVDEVEWSGTFSGCKCGYYSAFRAQWASELDADGKWHGLRMFYVSPEFGAADVDVEAGEVAPYTTAASVYDGYLYDGEMVVGSVQVKIAKGKRDRKTGEFSAKVTATVQLAGESKKLSFKGGVADEKGLVTEMSDKNGHRLAVTVGVKGLGGTFDGKYRIDGARNVFKGKSAADAAERYQGAYNVVFGDGTLSVAVDKKGKAKVSGTVGGNKVSATGQLVVGEAAATVPVVIAKKVNVAFCLWLGPDGKVELRGLEGAVAGKAGVLNAGARFGIDSAALALTDMPGLLTEYLPTNVEVVRNGTKLVVAGGAKAGKLTLVKGTSEIDREKSKFTDNMSGLKLSYKAKDGTFTGSFKVYGFGSGKIKSYTATVTGVMIGARGYGTATIKNVGTMAVTIE